MIYKLEKFFTAIEAPTTSDIPYTPNMTILFWVKLLCAFAYSGIYASI